MLGVVRIVNEWREEGMCFFKDLEKTLSLYTSSRLGMACSEAPATDLGISAKTRTQVRNALLSKKVGTVPALLP